MSLKHGKAGFGVYQQEVVKKYDASIDQVPQQDSRVAELVDPPDLGSGLRA